MTGPFKGPVTRTIAIVLVAAAAGLAGFGLTRLSAVTASASGPAAAMAKPAQDPGADFDALHQGLLVSDYLRGEVLAQGGSSIAVLVPYAMTRDAATAQASGFSLKIKGDGYTAVMGDDALDTVINGTKGAQSEGFEGEDDYMRPYEDFDDGRGGSLAFGFRGADYQVEMYCLAQAPDPEANCLKSQDLEAFVYGLMGK